MKFSTQIVLSTIAFLIIGFIYKPIIKEVLKTSQNPFSYSHVLINN